MGSFTDYAEKKLLDHALGITSWPVPADLYHAVGLYDFIYPGWDESGTGGVEPAAALGYARVAANTWDVVTVELLATSSRVFTRNTDAIAFGPSTGAWGSNHPRYGAIFDAMTGGNCLAYYEMNTLSGDPPVAHVGKQLTLPAGEVKWYLESLSGSVQAYWSIFAKRYALQHLFRISSWLPPTVLYLGLTRLPVFISDPETYTERTGGGYTRVNVTGGFSAAATGGDGRGVSTNSAAVNFPVAGAAWNLASDLDQLTLFDAATGGNVLFWFKWPGGTLPNIPAGDRLVIPANYLQVHFD